MDTYYEFVEDNLNRIKKGMYFDLALNPFDSDFIDRMIEFYEESEEYEKCQYLLVFKKKRFNHKYGYKNLV
tara:strand:+ start:75 stop:287 length:213 start_codon:yes stop_codon:yes gene_type:complete